MGHQLYIILNLIGKSYHHARGWLRLIASKNYSPGKPYCPMQCPPHPMCTIGVVNRWWRRLFVPLEWRNTRNDFKTNCRVSDFSHTNRAQISNNFRDYWPHPTYSLLLDCQSNDENSGLYSFRAIQTNKMKSFADKNNMLRESSQSRCQHTSCLLAPKSSLFFGPTKLVFNTISQHTHIYIYIYSSLY